MLIIQIRTEPIKHGHKVVANTFNARFSAVDYILFIRFYILIPRGLSKLYILVNGYRFYHFHLKPGVVA